MGITFGGLLGHQIADSPAAAAEADVVLAAQRVIAALESAGCLGIEIGVELRRRRKLRKESPLSASKSSPNSSEVLKASARPFPYIADQLTHVSGIPAGRERVDRRGEARAGPPQIGSASIHGIAPGELPLGLSAVRQSHRPGGGFDPLFVAGEPLPDPAGIGRGLEPTHACDGMIFPAEVARISRLSRIAGRAHR